MESEPLTLLNTEISLEDWALTPPAVQQTLLRVIARLVALEEDISQLRIENERLWEQSQRFSRNRGEVLSCSK